MTSSNFPLSLEYLFPSHSWFHHSYSVQEKDAYTFTIEKVGFPYEGERWYRQEVFPAPSSNPTQSQTELFSPKRRMESKYEPTRAIHRLNNTHEEKRGSIEDHPL